MKSVYIETISLVERLHRQCLEVVKAELDRLGIRDLNLDARRVIIRAGKGDKTRVVPITEELASDLRLLIGRRTRGPIFLSNRQGPLTTRQVNRIVKQAGESVGTSSSS